MNQADGKTIEEKMNKLAIIISVIATSISTAVLILFWSVPSEIKGVNVQIEQQSMLLHRALGKIIPYTLPPDIESQLAAIEKQLADESKWPETATDVQKLNEKLATLVNGLPFWAQEELLPRIAPRRWEIDALWVLANKPTAEDVGKHEKAVESALLQKPFNASGALEERLKSRQIEIEKMIAGAERVSAVATAKLALEGKGDPETAASLLDSYVDEEAKQLSAKLRSLVLSNAVSTSVEGMNSELTKYEKMENEGLKEYAFLRAHQGAQDIRLRVITSGLADNKPKDELAALEKRIADNLTKLGKARKQRDAEKLKQYQVWALQQIKLVRPYETVEAHEISKIGSVISRKNPFSDARKKATKDAQVNARDELIKYMAPINQGLLDEAVGQWFRKVYQQRFEKLGETKQLEVVKAFATADKYTLENLANK